MANSKPELVLEEARRLLARQEANLDGLRTRAAAMLSVAALAGGLFGGRSTGDRSALATGGVVVALVLFVVTAALLLWVQRPREFTFSHDLSDWINDLREGRPVDATEFAYNISRDLNDYRQQNKTKIDHLACCYLWICGLVALQVVAWALSAIS
ncbi:MAG: hypothetical protein M3P96_06765 [Actinomycetota bacterium]|nr:hypothetical protein [Actinomycetota bacterium]